jgi:hypothetical protein
MNAQVDEEDVDKQAKSDTTHEWGKMTFVEIRVFNDHFDIRTDHEPGWNLNMTNHLPLWASEYLTVRLCVFSNEISQ